VLTVALTLIGLATGPMQALLGVIAQNDVPIARVGSVSSALLFARQMGASWGLAALNALYSYNLSSAGDVRPALQVTFMGMTLPAIALVLSVTLLPDSRLRRHYIEEEISA
jgi:hypothetical protein